MSTSTALYRLVLVAHAVKQHESQDAGVRVTLVGCWSCTDRAGLPELCLVKACCEALSAA